MTNSYSYLFLFTFTTNAMGICIAVQSIASHSLHRWSQHIALLKHFYLFHSSAGPTIIHQTVYVCQLFLTKNSPNLSDQSTIKNNKGDLLLKSVLASILNKQTLVSFFFFDGRVSNEKPTWIASGFCPNTSHLLDFLHIQHQVTVWIHYNRIILLHQKWWSPPRWLS